MSVREPILTAKHVSKTFNEGTTHPNLVLRDIQLTLCRGEIVAIVGPSGSGKSTLLKTLCGLIQPTNGEVIYQNEVVHRPNGDMSMVFQTNTLLPWLTVLGNVEICLEARGIARKQRREMALKVIDMVGLDGFESAYPKELSGGMIQRVNLVRSLVIDPVVLFLDEPFSALDVLTADNLRGDLIDIWQGKKTRLAVIVVVTHNIEEAVHLADRIIVFGTNPGCVKSEIAVNIPHPRDEKELLVNDCMDKVYQEITQLNSTGSRRGYRSRAVRLDHKLPCVEVSALIGLVEELSGPMYELSVDLSLLCEELRLDLDVLIPMTEAAEILRLCHLHDGQISLSQIGRIFSEANINDQKNLFAKQLLECVPLARYIRQSLGESPHNNMSVAPFITLLRNRLMPDEAQEVLDTVIQWGRYAELFAYDVNRGLLSLDDPT